MFWKACSAVGIAGLANAVEDAPGLGLLFGFVAQERVFQRDMMVRGIEAHGFGKLVARRFVLPDLQQRVGEILANGGAVGRGFQGEVERGDGLVVVAGVEGLESLV